VRACLDVENSTKERIVKDKTKNDILPFHGTNELISVGVQDIDTGQQWYFFFNHNDLKDPEVNKKSTRELQELLDKCSLLVGHNFKHDLIWLLSCGFRVTCKKFWDTQIVEYLLAKGQVGQSFALAALAEKYDLPRKKSDLVDAGKLYYTDMALVEEYGLGDINTTTHLFKHQELRMYEKKNRSLAASLIMMNELMEVLARWQSNGIKIDRVELANVRAEYVKERDALNIELKALAREVMGDTPFNLNSPDDKSMIIFSRKVVNKKDWKSEFNIGTNDQGKKKRRPRLSQSQFKAKIRNLSEVVHRTRATRCEACHGKGRYHFKRKDGSLSKAVRICKQCSGNGVIYSNTGKVAGFKFTPKTVKDVSAGGFETSHAMLERLAKEAPSPEAKRFVEGTVRLNALNTYISTFCDGILNNITKRNFLHTNFNQTITATGRLSSSDPNFQNQPRGSTFPVRRAVVSRFDGGHVIEADYGQLEFRCAAAMSHDEAALQDILNKVDVHVFTRDTLNAAGLDIDRQGAKTHTFKPLYGGEYGTPAEMTYYQAFKDRYKGVAKWQDECCESVINTKLLEIPSGRQYNWPNAYRDYKGKVQPKTQIVNYPVQGFATGDIVPLACILVDREMQRRNLKSIPFLTVHDSVVVDTHPDELEIIPQLLADCMLAVKKEMLARYNYEFTVPLSVEVKSGINWLDSKEVLTKEHKYDTTVLSESSNDDDFFDDPLDDIGVA